MTDHSSDANQSNDLFPILPFGVGPNDDAAMAAASDDNSNDSLEIYWPDAEAAVPAAEAPALAVDAPDPASFDMADVDWPSEDLDDNASDSNTQHHSANATTTGNSPVPLIAGVVPLLWNGVVIYATMNGAPSTLPVDYSAGSGQSSPGSAGEDQGSPGSAGEDQESHDSAGNSSGPPVEEPEWPSSDQGTAGSAGNSSEPPVEEPEWPSVNEDTAGPAGNGSDEPAWPSPDNATAVSAGESGDGQDSNDSDNESEDSNEDPLERFRYSREFLNERAAMDATLYDAQWTEADWIQLHHLLMTVFRVFVIFWQACDQYKNRYDIFMHALTIAVRHKKSVGDRLEGPTDRMIAFAAMIIASEVRHETTRANLSAVKDAVMRVLYEVRHETLRGLPSNAWMESKENDLRLWQEMEHEMRDVDGFCAHVATPCDYLELFMKHSRAGAFDGAAFVCCMVHMGFMCSVYMTAGYHVERRSVPGLGRSDDRFAAVTAEELGMAAVNAMLHEERTFLVCPDVIRELGMDPRWIYKIAHAMHRYMYALHKKTPLKEYFSKDQVRAERILACIDEGQIFATPEHSPLTFDWRNQRLFEDGMEVPTLSWLGRYVNENRYAREQLEFYPNTNLIIKHVPIGYRNKPPHFEEKKPGSAAAEHVSARLSQDVDEYYDGEQAGKLVNERLNQDVDDFYDGVGSVSRGCSPASPIYSPDSSYHGTGDPDYGPDSSYHGTGDPDYCLDVPLPPKKRHRSGGEGAAGGR